MMTSSFQETSDEGSVQFDSSSEETKLRYVIRVVPSKWNRDESVNVEVTTELFLFFISRVAKEQVTIA